MRLIPMIVLAALATPLLAQSGSNAQVFSGTQIHAQLNSIASHTKAEHGGSVTLGDYSTHILLLSLRTATGEAEAHAHYNDVIVVTGGNATLKTGGSLVAPHTVGEGETKGSGIQGGVSRNVKAGDIAHIPAGTPHQLIIPPGVTYTAFVVKVKQ